MPAESLSTLLVGTLQAGGRNTLLYGLLSLVSVLAALPLLGASQAMLYNGHAREDSAGFDVLRDVARAIRPLMLTALLCMLGTWLIEIIPSLVSGLFSAVAGLLSLVPVVGEILKIASILLTLVLNGAAQAAAAVLFCYVWISAGCEGVGGKGAVLRSLTLVRQQMESTLCAVIGILLLRWALTAAAGILWVIAYAVLGLPAAVLVYAGGILTAAQSVAMGLIASALYQGRSLQGYGFYSGRPDIDRMKSANL